MPQRQVGAGQGLTQVSACVTVNWGPHTGPAPAPGSSLAGDGALGSVPRLQARRLRAGAVAPLAAFQSSLWGTLCCQSPFSGSSWLGNHLGCGI